MEKIKKDFFLCNYKYKLLSSNSDMNYIRTLKKKESLLFDKTLKVLPFNQIRNKYS